MTDQKIVLNKIASGDVSYGNDLHIDFYSGDGSTVAAIIATDTSESDNLLLCHGANTATPEL